jgi:hypothetical protein
MCQGEHVLPFATVALSLLQNLGSSIERSWQSAEYDQSLFPRLCADELGKARLHEHVSPDDIVSAVFAGKLPQQVDLDATFGQPPVTLFRGRRFYIAALFWVDGTTTIHDHAFAGAFQVLAGESIEANFSFAPERDVGGNMRLGRLLGGQTALRRAGDVRAVPAGPSFIHSLFHLARPSVSLVVRTFKDPTVATQFNYSSSGIAVDPFLQDPVRDRTIQVCELLRETEDRQFEERVGDLIAGADAHTAFSIVQSCTKVADVTLLDRMVERIRDREVGNRVRRWVAGRRRTEFLITRRARVSDPELRFMLAVLLNSRRRVDVLALVAGAAPGVDPAKQTAAWLQRLSEVTIRLQIGSAPFEPNVLGLPPFGPGCEEGLADCLAGRDRSLTGEVQVFMDRLRALPVLEPLFIGNEPDGE